MPSELDNMNRLRVEAERRIRELESKLGGVQSALDDSHSEIMRLRELHRTALDAVEAMRQNLVTAQSRLDTVSRLNETNLAALLAMNELARGYEDRLDAVRGWLDSYGEDVGGVRSGELLRILGGAVENQMPFITREDIEKAALEPLPWDGRDMLVIKKTPE